MIYYSPANKGFFSSEVHQHIPPDGILIDADTHQMLLNGLADGKTIVTVGNIIKLVDMKFMSTSLQAAIADAVQKMMDKKAQEFGYDTIFTAVTYADEPTVSRFQAEGRALRAWRSLVWAKCYDIVEQVKAGKQYISMPEQVIAQLPPFSLE